MIRKRFAEEKKATENGITTTNTNGRTTDEADGGNLDSDDESFYCEKPKYLSSRQKRDSTDSSDDSEN